MPGVGLVLEGGGMRGLFTAGVLDAFLDAKLFFSYIVGVSAGVCHGINFVAGQRGRTRDINLDNISDKRYVSLSNLLHTGSMFGMDFIFDEVPNRLYPFDYDAFSRSPAEFVSGVTDVHTGRPRYFGRGSYADINVIARASSSIPVFSPIVRYKGGEYLDGGTSDPIPVGKALADGCGRVVAVLTRDRGFTRQPEKFRRVYRRIYRGYPELARCLDTRHEVYNRARARLAALEKEGRALIVAPPEPVGIGRFERDREKLLALYDQGCGQAKRQLPALRRFMEERPAGVPV